MVRRNLGLPHRLISKNFNCVIWVKTIQKILENNLDQIDFEQKSESEQQLPIHGNIRGKQYYN